jgi:uncharacterized integral membrane protein (TIGR00697 family)
MPDQREFKHYTWLGMFFVALLLVANTIGPKLVSFETGLGTLVLPAGLWIYPFTYLTAVTITEVYGYVRARKIIWFALLCNVMMALIYQIMIWLPGSDEWPHQQAFADVFNMSTRIVLASVVSYFCSEFLNAYLVAKLKIKLAGQYFYLRAVTAIGLSELVNTAVFAHLAYLNQLAYDKLLGLMAFYYFFKLSYALLSTPLLNYLVKFFKKSDNIDYYDYQTNFNPFSR